MLRLHFTTRSVVKLPLPYPLPLSLSLILLKQPLKEVIEVVSPVGGVMPMGIDIPGVRYIVLLQVTLKLLPDSYQTICFHRIAIGFEASPLAFVGPGSIPSLAWCSGPTKSLLPRQNDPNDAIRN